jgi:hypothetical protein
MLPRKGVRGAKGGCFRANGGGAGAARSASARAAGRGGGQPDDERRGRLCCRLTEVARAAVVGRPEARPDAQWPSPRIAAFVLLLRLSRFPNECVDVRLK